MDKIRTRIIQRRAAVAAGILLIFMAGTRAWGGPTLEISDESWIKISILGQPHFSYNDDAEDKADLYLRRGRLILTGQICDGAKVFIETDNANAGRDGCDGVSTELQDIFLDLRLGKSDHWLQTGLILLPFSFEVKSSAASLLGVDYNSETIKLDHCFVWRDYGAELHGSFGKRIGYHVGVFDGYDTGDGSLSSEARLRYTGHLACNLVGDVQTGWFYTQNRLAGEAYLSVGVGFDEQQDATLSSIDVDSLGGTEEISTIQDSSAWAVDFQSGWSMGSLGVTLNGALYGWDNSIFDGTTAFVETGLRLHKIMLTGKYSLQDSDTVESRIEDYTVGLHYFLKSHNLRGGIEYRNGDSDDAVLLGMQFLL